MVYQARLGECRRGSASNAQGKSSRKQRAVPDNSVNI